MAALPSLSIESGFPPGLPWPFALGIAETLPEDRPLGSCARSGACDLAFVLVGGGFGQED